MPPRIFQSERGQGGDRPRRLRPLLLPRAHPACAGSRYRPPALETGAAAAFKHIGLYVYRRDFLLAFPQLPPTPLEALEKLEQLRALEHGYRIRVAATELASQGVDTPEDLAAGAGSGQPRQPGK